MYGFDKLANLMRAQAVAIISTFSQTRVGIVTDYDPSTYRACVQIQPEGIKTSWLPILTTGIGDQYGFYYAPGINDMCIVHFQEGDFSSGIIGQFIYSLTDRPINPGPPSGETWMIHKTGSYLKFKNNGTIELKCLDVNGAKTNLNINANVVVSGNISATGDIIDNTNTNANTMKDMRDIYNEHVHPGVAPGPGSTLVTPEQM